jgi:metallothionein
MATYEPGTELTCTHEGCRCRIVVQENCNCEGAREGSYMCACGTRLIPVSERAS